MEGLGFQAFTHGPLLTRVFQVVYLRTVKDELPGDEHWGRWESRYNVALACVASTLIFSLVVVAWVMLHDLFRPGGACALLSIGRR
jgi:hypothetical protein